MSVMPGAKSQRHCKFVLASNNPLGIGLGIEVGIASQSQSEKLTAVSGASYIMRSPSLTVSRSPSLFPCLSSFFSCLLFKGATLKVAGCQVSHAFASFSLSTATFFLFMAPALRSCAAVEVVNSLLSLAVCQLATIASRLLPLAKLKLLL